MAPKVKWTDHLQFKLALYVSRHEAYKSTDVTLKIKWDRVLQDVLGDPLFKDIAITSATALKTHFDRMCEDMAESLGISKEEVNLSGLSFEDASELQKMLVGMMEEAANQKGAKKAKKEKKEKIQQALLGHEVVGMTQQGQFRARVRDTSLRVVQTDHAGEHDQESSPVLDDGSISDSKTISSKTSSAKSSTKRSKPAHWMLDLRNDLIHDLTADPEMAQVEIEEKRQKLRHEEEMHNLRVEERRSAMALEKQRLDQQDQQLKLNVQLVKVNFLFTV